MSPAPEAAMRAIVSGRVQGVNFRAFTAAHARALGLRGAVRNSGDGRTVQVYAEGARALLERLLVQIRQGPAFARVESVKVEWVTPEGGFSDFTIIR
jgi:acylphosphatase